MFRLCVLGDSHVAALKTGWDEIPEAQKAHLSVTYFGAQSQLLEGLEVQERSLITHSEHLSNKLAATSNGKTSIDVGDYDLFLIVGLSLNLRRLMTGPLSRHRTISYNTRAGNIYLISDACLMACANGVLGNSLAFETAEKLKSAGATRIAMIPQPAPSPQLLERDRGGDLFREFLKNGDGPEVYRLFRDAILSLSKAHSVEFVEQPLQTRQDGFFTKLEFSTGSVRLTERFDSPHSNLDFGHMNGRYGAHIWQVIVNGNLLK
jgi:hypothetical protein